MKKSALAFLILTLTATVSFAATLSAYTQFTRLLNAVTLVGTGNSYVFPQHTELRTHQAILGGASAISATVTVSGSNDGTNWTVLNTFSLATPASAVSGFVSQAPWIYERGEVTAISGAGATVTLTVGD